MEAIAHSPSFAKKVHIPQSVGKDYAAADKGKTFKRGGDMASKMKMFEKSGKDIEKKGMKEGSKADKALDKKQMMGMKAGGRVRRMAGGGMGDPFELSDTDRENYAKNGAENLKRLKGFFGFGDKEETRPMTMDNPPPSSGPRVNRPTASSTPSSTTEVKPPKFSTTVTSSPVSKPNIAAEMEEREKGGERGSANTGPDYGGDSSSSSQTFKAPVNKAPVKPAKKPVGFEKTVKKERVITEPVSKTPFKSDSPDLEGREESMKPKRKFGMASDETRASVRKGLGSVLDFFDLSKAHEREFGKKMAKGGNVKKMRYGGSPEDGMDMGQPMRGGPRPAPEAPMNPNSIAYLQSKYGMRPQGGPPMKAGGAVKKMAEGGFTREADGIAKKGKTQGKVVKMAKGGFVKNADGCAQRGKTKAFQVKMKNGGMC
jgi:hypothetical protein